MTPDEEKILKVTKEIMIKFIEMGRISPTGFSQYFKEVYKTIKETLEEGKHAGRRKD